MRILNIRTTIALALIGLWAILTAMPAVAACGGKDQRACCLTERIPSCNSGLEEKGKCSGDCGPLNCSIGMCRAKAAPPPPPTACGGEGQRACCALERLPSCNSGLIEKVGCTGNCQCGKNAATGIDVPGNAIGTCAKPPSCGKKGDKPCTLDVQVSQGRRSCDAGLAEDFINNKCVDDTAQFREAACKAIVNTMKAGKLPPGIAAIVDESKKKASGQSKSALVTQATNFIQPLKPIIPELQRIFEGTQKARDLFAADTICSPAALQAKLNAMSKELKPEVQKFLPTYSGHFFMSYMLTASVAAGPGIQAGYAVATDYLGSTGVYVFVGPAIVFNASLGDSVGVEFYPKVNLKDFEGWGYGVGVSGGPPTKIFSGGIDVPIGATDKGVPTAPQGIGISAGIGLGALPVDFGISATYSFKLWSTN